MSPGRAAAGALLVIGIAGCAGPRPDPTVRAPAFGSSTSYGARGGYRTVHHSAAWYRAHHVTHHATHGTTHGSTHVHHATPSGPPEDFSTRTRARCDAGDAGACRMLQAMGQ